MAAQSANRLCFFGKPSLYENRRLVPFGGPRRAVALLAYLVQHRDTALSREAVAELFNRRAVNGIMNRLPLSVRVQVLSALVEGNSIRGTCRMLGVDKKTVLRLLAEVADYCDQYMAEGIHGLQSQRLQLDEIWSFCNAKERNLPREMRGADGVGDLWTWTAIDPDTKLIVTWHLGKRTKGDADLFLRDLAARRF